MMEKLLKKQTLIQNGIVPYDSYKQDYIKNDKFLEHDKVNKEFTKLDKYIDKLDQQSGLVMNKLKKWFFGSELGKKGATKDSYYYKLLQLKEDYLDERSEPYLTEEEVKELEEKYMNFVESLIKEINKKTKEKYGFEIPIYVDYQENENDEFITLDQKSYGNDNAEIFRL